MRLLRMAVTTEYQLGDDIQNAPMPSHRHWSDLPLGPSLWLLNALGCWSSRDSRFRPPRPTPRGLPPPVALIGGKALKGETVTRAIFQSLSLLFVSSNAPAWVSLAHGASIARDVLAGRGGRGGLSAHAQAVAASASALTPRVPSACLTTATGPRAYAIHREGPSHCRVRRPGPVRWVGAEGTGGGTPAEEASAARRGARDSARAPAAGGGRWRLRLPGEPASHRSLLAPKCDFFKKSKNVVFINM